MQNQPPPGYQPGSWQHTEPYPPTMPPGPMQAPFEPPRTQTFNMPQNVAAGLCYLPLFLLHIVLPIIFVASEPKSNRFVRFHAFQALFLTLAWFVGGIGGYVAFILSMVLAAFATALVPALGIIVFILGLAIFGALVLSMLVCTVVACVKAFTGQMWKIPVIGHLAERCL